MIIFTVLALLAIAAGLTMINSDDEKFVRWRDGTTHGRWRAVFDGHGRNGIRDGVISLRPQAATTGPETHAGLVVSHASYGNVDFQVRLRTVAQLRTPKPNPWEVAWVAWAYTDEHHFYYLTLKPNGWELGKRDPAYTGGQRFLATGPPSFPLKRWYDVQITQQGATSRVWVDGKLLVTHTDTERPYTRGAVGLYTEDAEVEFRDIKTR